MSTLTTDGRRDASDRMTYARHLGLDTLLAGRHPHSDQYDEMLNPLDAVDIDAFLTASRATLD